MFTCLTALVVLHLRLLNTKPFDLYETNLFRYLCSISVIIKNVFHNIIRKYFYIFEI